MGKELVLGIDYGGKYTGIAVVDRKNNAVLYSKSIEMLDISDTLKDRRAQRSIRRCNQSKKKRLRDVRAFLIKNGFKEDTTVFKDIYRLAHKRGWDYAPFEEMPSEELEAMDKKEREALESEWQETKALSRHRDEVIDDVRKAMRLAGSAETQIENLVDIFNMQYRKKRFHNRILTKCKICGKNTPKRRNVRELLLNNIIRYMQIEDADKETLKSMVLSNNEEGTTGLFKRLRKIYKITLNQTDYPGKNLMDIATNKLPGRLPFCKEHFIENEKYTTIEKSVFRLAPSLKTKIENVAGVIEKEILPRFAPLSGVVMESNNFDISAKSAGKKKKAKDEYQKGNREAGETLKETLIRETGEKCIYCAKPITSVTAQIDHIYPQKSGGINIFANLVACCAECNNRKNGRTPQESGVLPQADIVKKIGNDLKKKILNDSTTLRELDFNKYMSHASIGWRYMRDRLRAMTDNLDLPIERQSGIVTAHFRKWWGFIKERANHTHHALDAVILASQKGHTEDGRVDMTLKPRAEDGSEFDPAKHVPIIHKIPKKFDNRGAPLHDSEPLSFKNGDITKRVPVTSIKRGKEKYVVSEKHRERIKEAFERFEIKDGKCLTDDQAKEFGLYFENDAGRKRAKAMSVKYGISGTGPGQLVKINNNVFKSNVHNVAVEIYLDGGGSKKARIMKNPRLSKHLIEKPENIDGRTLFTLRRGDIVEIEGEGMPYKIVKLGSSPTLAPLNGGKERSVSAVRLRKINSGK